MGGERSGMLCGAGDRFTQLALKIGPCPCVRKREP
jgi:hypothetical protein